MNKALKIGIAVVICAAVGYFSGVVTQDNITTWYPTIIKPSFNPPNWIFAPVWTTLYILMGISAGLVWSHFGTQKELVKKGLLFFAVQLFLNALWSFIFFEWHNLLLASVEIVLLVLLIFETYLTFKRVDKTAAYLLIPYLLWVSFATILTISIYVLNY